MMNKKAEDMAASKEVSPMQIHQVGSFKVNLMDILGKGAFGIVHMATDEKEEKVAAKRLDLVGRSKVKLEKIRGFANRLPELSHNNVVKVLGVEEEGDSRLWIMMEFCTRGDLSVFYGQIEALGGFSELEEVQMMADIASGVHYLHSQNIIHRDIKPANILIHKSTEKKYIPKLTDFDLSKFLEEDYDTSRMTSDVGTLAFKAPEFFIPDSQGKINYHRNVDIYALGLTYLAMVQRKDPLLPEIETPTDESDKHARGIGILISQRIRYKVKPLEIVSVRSKPSVVNSLKAKIGMGGASAVSEMSAVGLGIRKMIKKMTSVDPTQRISAHQVQLELVSLVEETNQFEYDAFVCSSGGDYGWVGNTMMDGWKFILEKEHGFRFGIAHRDFVPGPPLRDQIYKFIRCSRRVVCLLSRNFFNSMWCKEELEMAHLASLEQDRGDLMILVLLEPLDLNAMSPNKKHIWSRCKRIDGTRGPKHVNEQLRSLLPKPTVLELELARKLAQEALEREVDLADEKSDSDEKDASRMEEVDRM